MLSRIYSVVVAVLLAGALLCSWCVNCMPEAPRQVSHCSQHPDSGKQAPAPECGGNAVVESAKADIAPPVEDSHTAVDTSIAMHVTAVAAAYVPPDRLLLLSTLLI